MSQLTPIQQQIIQHLPASADELAQALYARATVDERNLVYVHIYHLRRRLNGRGRITTRRRQRDDFDASPCHIIYEFEEEES